jgi:hypothetical protein
MKYCVDLDADELADELWERHAGAPLRNTPPPRAKKSKGAATLGKPQTRIVKRLSKRRAWDSNPQPHKGAPHFQCGC